MKKSSLEGLKRFLSESVLIVLSVLFALLIDKCQNDTIEAKRTETILFNIKNEINTNKAAVQRLIGYHEEMVETLNAIPKDSLEVTFFPKGEMYLFDVLYNGISQEVFQDIAWEAAKQENISARIDFKQAKTLFKTFEQQKVVETTISDMSDLLRNREMQRKERLGESITLLKQLFEEVSSQEKPLLFYYDEALDMLEGVEQN